MPAKPYPPPPHTLIYGSGATYRLDGNHAVVHDYSAPNPVNL